MTTGNLRPTRPSREAVDDDDGGPSTIHSGWSEAQKQQEAASTFAPVFKPEAQTKVIKFMEDAPYASFRRHWVDRMGPNGPYKRAYTCLDTVGKACPLCDAGNKAGSVAAFNVVELGDDGQLFLRTWDLGPRLLGVIKNYHNDNKVGPLSKGFFGVTKTEDRNKRGGTTQTNVFPIKPSQLEEDYNVPPPAAGELAAIKLYDSSIVVVPPTSELREVAAELIEDD